MKGEFCRVLTPDGLERQGILATPDSGLSETSVLHVHGLAGNFYENRFVDTIADAATSRGMNFLTANNRGHDYISDFIVEKGDGTRESRQIGGIYEIFDECLGDISAWAGFLRSLGSRRTILQGHSHGALKVTYYSHRGDDPDIVGIVLLSPSDDFGCQRQRIGDAFDEALEVARKMIERGDARELMPSRYFHSPASAQTYLDIFTRDSALGMFNLSGTDRESLAEIESMEVPATLATGLNPTSDGDLGTPQACPYRFSFGKSGGQNPMTDVYKILKDQAIKKTANLGDDDFTIRGLWKVDLAFKPNVDERTFRYSFLVSQTVGQGSCYCDEDLVIDEGLIGRDAREIIADKDCYSISVLDSIYASIARSPYRVFEISGNSIEKTTRRNTILLNEVEHVLGEIKPKGRKPRVINIGVLGTLIKSLTDRKYSVVATDLDERILGTSIHGVTVEHGSRNFQLIPDADVVVITGMALTTDALGDIIDVCKQNQAKIIIFAETGAHFGEEYCQTLGVDSVLSEPFPFYIFQGVSRIEIYRRETR